MKFPPCGGDNMVREKPRKRRRKKHWHQTEDETKKYC
jgi:hypothetical protein